MIQYPYAFDSSDNVININTVTQDNRASMQFSCIDCGVEMEAVLGKIKQHHFRHKVKGDCNPETYRHHLAKRVLKKDKFDSQTQFVVKYYVNKCSQFSMCELIKRHNWEDCPAIVLKEIDLKEYYNTCEEEVPYKGFRPDLLLTHSEHPERVLFLEISVTHDCEQNKIDSKIRIIEIKVESEIDASIEIVENDGEFVEKNTKPTDNNIPLVRFYNFERKGEASRYSICPYFDKRDKEIPREVRKSIPSRERTKRQNKTTGTISKKTWLWIGGVAFLGVAGYWWYNDKKKKNKFKYTKWNSQKS
jgi:hypothetical protein